MTTTKTTKTTTTAAPAANGKPQLSVPSHRTLVFLAGAKRAMSQGDIKRGAFKGVSTNLKPVLAPLLDRKLIRCRTINLDDKAVIVYDALAAGKKLAARPLPVKVAAPRNKGVRGTAEAGNLKLPHKRLPKAGNVFVRHYKGKDIRLMVNADGSVHVLNGPGKGKYPSLSKAAKGVKQSDSEVNGWRFFNLVNVPAAE
jgi:hypothetical protein